MLSADDIQTVDGPRRRHARADDDAGGLTPKKLSSSSLGSLTRNASLAQLADVLNGNDERHGAALLRSALAAFLRGATVGGVLKGGLGLLGLLAKLRSRKPVKGKLGAEAKSALRYALFLGCYASGFRLVEGTLARTVKGSEPWRAAAAGFLVAPTFVIADSQPSASLSVYIALRATLLALRSAKRNTTAFSGAGKSLFEHGPILSMCASASVLLHAWLLEPESLPSTYVRFLDRHGGKGRAVVDALQEVTKTGSMGAKLPAVLDWYARNQPNATSAIAAVPQTCSHPCAIVHPGQGHLEHALLFALRGIPAAIPVYVPVYAVSAALVQRSNLVRPACAGNSLYAPSYAFVDFLRVAQAAAACFISCLGGHFEICSFPVFILRYRMVFLLHCAQPRRVWQQQRQNEPRIGAAVRVPRWPCHAHREAQPAHRAGAFLHRPRVPVAGTLRRDVGLGASGEAHRCWPSHAEQQFHHAHLHTRARAVSVVISERFQLGVWILVEEERQLRVAHILNTRCLSFINASGRRRAALRPFTPVRTRPRVHQRARCPAAPATAWSRSQAQQLGACQPHCAQRAALRPRA